MRPTRLWRAIAATAGGLLLVAAITVRITPAAIGLATMVYLAHTRWAARHAFERASLRLRREVMADTVHRQHPVEVRLDAENSLLPHGIDLVVEDQVPEGLELLDQHARLRGATRRTYRVQARETGSKRWQQVRARLEDSRGLWRHEQTVGLETEVRVLPSKQRLEAGRRLAKRNPLQAQRQDRRGTVMKELEFASLREFQPRDRLRDVDWKQFAKLDELMTREFEREREAPVVFLVDAGRTMRQSSALATDDADDRTGEGGSEDPEDAEGGDGDEEDTAEAKLDFAADIVLELAESASAQGHAVGMVAFDELEIVETLRPSERRQAPSRMAELVAELPGRLRAQRRLDVGLPDGSPVDETELDVLEQLAAVRHAASSDREPSPASGEAKPDAAEAAGPSPSVSSPPGSTDSGSAGLGFQRAVREIVAQVGGDRVALIALTDLEGFPDEAVRTLGRLAARGHWVLTGVLPGTWFLDPPDRVRARDLENAYKEIETRRRAQRLLEARGVRVIELGPWSTAAMVAEASGEDPTRSRAQGAAGGDSRHSPSPDEDRGEDREEGRV